MTTNKMGRPNIEINDRKLANFMRLKPTLEDTAAFFECNARTIERHIKSSHNMTFVEFRQRNMAHTRHNLVRKAIAMALKGNTAMMIFALKNLCGWTDRQDPVEGEDVSGGVTFKLAYNLDTPTKKGE